MTLPKRKWMTHRRNLPLKEEWEASETLNKLQFKHRFFSKGWKMKRKWNVHTNAFIESFAGNLGWYNPWRRVYSITTLWNNQRVIKQIFFITWFLTETFCCNVQRADVVNTFILVRIRRIDLSYSRSCGASQYLYLDLQCLRSIKSDHRYLSAICGKEDGFDMIVSCRRSQFHKWWTVLSYRRWLHWIWENRVLGWKKPNLLVTPWHGTK